MNERIGLFKNFHIILLLFLISACSEKDPIGMKWKFKGTFKEAHNFDRGYSRLIVTDNTVYFGAKGQLYALDIENGREKWKFKSVPEDATNGPRFFLMSKEIIGVWIINTLHAVDAIKGQEKWIFPYMGRRRTSPMVLDGLVYFGTSEKNGNENSHLFAVDIKTGQKTWEFYNKLNKNDNYRINSDLVADGKNLCFNFYKDNLSSSGNTIYYFNSFLCLDAKTGKTVRTGGLQKSIPAPALSTGDITSNPDLGDEMIAIGTDIDGIHGVNTKTGLGVFKLKWKGDIVILPTVKNGVLFFGSKNYLYAVDIKGISRPTP